jgi:hypothetical protein
MSSRSMIGSSMLRGRSARILAMASLTSFSARSVFTSRRNSTTVDDWPSVRLEMTFLTPVMLATASSTRLEIWLSSSAGAAPACVTLIWMSGTSMFGKRVIGRLL